ncbi:type II secretion system protein G [Methylophaga sp.]|uniref:type II secretion system protein G n=1 Tax=Methylophaga sp. TaxID=2024840 RepID=UPI0025E78C78|nr:type II secretion system protein G [Methylophaga sp.]
MENKKTLTGFTIIGFLIAAILIALILTLAAPQYMQSVDRSKEKVLRHDLIVMRSAIDQYLNDHNEYPSSLQELVEGQYLREVPIDPITDREDTWVFSKPISNEYAGSIADVFSGSLLISSEGTPYAEW